MVEGSRRWFESLPVRGKLIVTLSIQLAVLTVVSLSFLVAQREVARAREWTNHIHLVIELTEALRAEAIAQQTGMRGYLISGQRNYLEPYADGSVAFDRLSAQLHGQVGDNPLQRARLQRIDDLMQQWRSEVAVPRIEDRSTVTVAAVDGIDQDKRLIDAIKQECAEMIDRERGYLVEREAELVNDERLAQVVTVLLLLVGWFAGVRAVRSLHRGIGQPLSELAGLVPRLAGAQPVEVPFRERRDEVGVLSGALERLRRTNVDQSRREWVAEHSSRILAALQGGRDEYEFAETLLRHLCSVLGAGYGLAWRWDDDQGRLEWCGAYGLPDPALVQRRFARGEGLVGQVLVEQRAIEVSPVPEGYLKVMSGLGTSPPHTLAVLPVTARGQTVAVLELGLLQAPDVGQRNLLDAVLTTAGLAWFSLSRSLETRTLLAQSQARAQELHDSQEALHQQQEQLRGFNEALRSRTTQLEEQGRRLAASEREMREQARELRGANEALEERTRLLRLRQAELENARAELERKAADLENASRYKSEFLANMSHELRTPLNSMLILSRVLADNAQGNLDAEQVESARIVHDSGQSLLELINDILDLSKVEAGKMKLDLEAVDVRTCLQVLAARFRPVATQRGLGFDVEVDAAVPAQIRTDGSRLEQILGNLLSNALKFTHHGGVRLHAAVQGSLLRLGVRDTGIGIPADHLSRVFEAFEQAEGGTSRKYGGTGLGLSIVSGMARLLGGEVTVESRVGEGSEFAVLLPLQGWPVDGATNLPVPASTDAATAPAVARPHTTPAAAAPPALQAQREGRLSPVASAAPQAGVAEGLAGRTVLIVDDDMRNVFALSKALRDCGINVVPAQDGQKVLGLLDTRDDIELVLTDIMMPVMDGYALIGHIRRHPRYHALPIIAVTANAMLGDRQKCLDAGASDYCPKPVEMDRLLAQLRTWLVATPPVPLTEPAP